MLDGEVEARRLVSRWRATGGLLCASKPGARDERSGQPVESTSHREAIVIADRAGLQEPIS
jgi:hypothetical protein